MATITQEMKLKTENQTENRPEFCPNPTCPFHDKEKAAKSRWFYRFGTYRSNARGLVNRYSCRHCGKTCSSQTFSIHYWTHFTVDMQLIKDRLSDNLGYNALTRESGLSYHILKNRFYKLPRLHLENQRKKVSIL